MADGQPVRSGTLAAHPLLVAEDLWLALFSLGLSTAFVPSLDDQLGLPKLLVLRLAIVGFLLLFVLRTRTKNLCLRPPKRLLVATLAFAGWSILATAMAVQPYTSLHGNYGRYNGLWTYACYCIVLLLLATTPIDPRRLLRLFRLLTLALLPAALYTLFQTLQLDPFIWNSSDGRPGSWLGHPVPLGTVMAFAALFTLGGWFHKRSVGQRALGAVLLALFLYALVSTLSRGPILALGATLLLVGVRLVWSHRGRTDGPKLARRLKALVAPLAVGLPLLAVLLANLPWQALAARWVPDHAVESRWLFFTTAGRMIQDRPILGAGFENYRTLYPIYSQPRHHEIAPNVLPTMVHNEWLQLAVEVGFPGALLVLVVLGSAAMPAPTGRRTKHPQQGLVSPTGHLVRSTLVAALILYGLQSLTGWSHLGVTPLFWALLGLYASQKAGQQRPSVGLRKTMVSITAAALLLFTWLSYEAMERLIANHLVESARSEPALRQERFQATQREPFESDFWYAQAFGHLAFKDFQRSHEAEQLEEAHRWFERASRLNPHDPYLALDAFSVELASGLTVDDSRANEFSTAKAEEHAQHAAALEARLLDLASDNATLLLAAARLRLQNGQLSEARQLANQAAAFQHGTPKNLITLASLFIHSGDCTSALPPLRRATQSLRHLDPQAWQSAQLLLVDCLIDSQKPHTARSELAKVLVGLPESQRRQPKISKRIQELKVLTKSLAAGELHTSH